MEQTNKKRWWYTNRELVVMAIMIASIGAFQTVWSYLTFTLNVLGPFQTLLQSFGFNIWGFVALYFVPKRGTATIVKLFAGILEFLLVSPIPMCILYSVFEGVATDLAYMMFRRKITINMCIVTHILVQLMNMPETIINQAIPLQISPMVTFFAPHFFAIIFTGWLCGLTMVAIKKTKWRDKIFPVVIQNKKDPSLGNT